MNEKAEKILVALEGEGFPIYFEFKDIEENNRVGYAESRLDHCQIYFSNDIRDNEILLRNVTIHEIGHCYGLGHIENENDIYMVMNKITPSYSLFSSKAIELFIDQLSNCVSIHNSF